MTELTYRAVERLLTHLENRGLMEPLQLSDEDIADTIWLALQMGVVETASEPKQPNEQQSDGASVEDGKTTPLETTPEIDSSVNVYSQNSITPDSKTEESQSQETNKSLPFQAPAAPALQNKLPIGRALRPLMRKVDSATKKVFDAEATVNRIVEQDIWLPVTKPQPERWLNLELVIEESRSSFIWQETIDELQKLLQNHGAFRTVRVWSLSSPDNQHLELTRRRKGSQKTHYKHSYRELIYSNGRGLILVVSDCVSDIWQQWEIYQWLQKWSNKVPTAIMQLFPERLWQSSSLGLGYKLQLSAFNPGVPNYNLELPSLWEELKQQKILKLPVVTPEAFSLADWAKVVAAHGNISTPGFVFELEFLEEQLEQQINQEPDKTQDKQSATDKPQEVLLQEAENLVDRFFATASPTAQELSGYMAAVPVDLKVVNLIRKTLLRESTPVNVAEVFLSGMIKRTNAANNNQNPQYEFIRGARKLLNQATRLTKTENVLNTLSKYIARELKFPSSIKTFRAFLSRYQELTQQLTHEQQEQILPFGKITLDVLENLGGEYADFAKQVAPNIVVIPSPESTPDNENDQIPQLKTCNFKVAIIDEILETRTFEFDVATLEQKSLFLGLGNRWVDNRQKKQATSIIEVIQPEVELELIEIPGGSFTMGAPETEEVSRNRERPQHQVTVPSFFMGKYQVTQAQWKAVANLPQIERELQPEPSHFKGDNRPVEQVSWYDAVEFCARLSKHTGREYRLPSEAEWEYACRAGTTTPFHFGETITTGLANYDGSSYGNGPKGKNRGETTPVGSFGVANGFGLYDMHGNVWEWCLDDWHDNYENAPTDGSAWLDDNENLARKSGRAMLRGGSWYLLPEYCRCASRFDLGFAQRVNFNDFIGFRVVCAFGRTFR